MVVMGFVMFSQSTLWKPHNSNLDTAWGIRWMSVVDTNSVWAIGNDGWSSSTSIKFTRTEDGNTFVPGTFLPDTLYYASSNISAVNDSVAYIPCYSKDASRNGVIMKTMNRGVTWTNVADTLGTMFVGSANFPDWAYFYNNNHGITLGDPNGGNFEIWITYDGGTSWTRVPSANIPTPGGTEYGLTDSYFAYGKKHLWFGTSHSANAIPHVYRSNDTGHTWQSAQVTGMLAGVSKLAFRDSMNGLCWGATALSGGKFLVKRTTDGGATWSTVYQHNQVGTYDISVVPGRNAYVSVGIDSASTGYITSITYDDGNTWTVLETGTTPAVRMVKVGMVDSLHGWAGNFSDGTLPFGNGGMNSWMGPKINQSCPLNLTGPTNICSGTSAVLTASGGAATYTWMPGPVNTNTISVSPTSTAVYTVNSVTSGGCSNSATYTVNVTITPSVTVTSPAVHDSICSGTSTTLNGAGTTTSYSWTPLSSITGTGATVSAHPTVTTTYTLTGHTGTCIGTNTITIFVANCAGINQFSVNGTSASFYPNPSNGMITVDLYNVKTGTSVMVSDMLGKEVYKTTLIPNGSVSQSLNIDLSALPKGVYLFGLKNGSESKVQKLVIQ